MKVICSHREDELTCAAAEETAAGGGWRPAAGGGARGRAHEAGVGMAVGLGEGGAPSHHGRRQPTQPRAAHSLERSPRTVPTQVALLMRRAGGPR